MAILRINLVSRVSRGEHWGEGSMYQVGTSLREYFNSVCAGYPGFEGSDFTWEANSSAVGDLDVVCYLVSRPFNSIARNHTSQPLGVAGTTVWSTRSRAMISEVYMSAVEGDRARNRLLANLIFHELMHNKLDAHPDRYVVDDIHVIQGGSISHVPVNSSAHPSSSDLAQMRRGLGVQIPQYTRLIPASD
jgi:hypothetical protein